MFRRSSLSHASHLTLLVVGTLISLALVTFLVFGWWQFFLDRERREMLSRQDEASNQRSSLIAAQTAGESAPPQREAPAVPASPRSLPPEAASQGPGDDPHAGVGELVPVAEPVAPGQLAAATALLRDFWRAATWSEKAAYVRQPARVRPLMQEYYEGQRNKDPATGPLIRTSHFRHHDEEVLMFVYGGPQAGSETEVAMVAGAGGVFLLDWESYVGWGEMPFQAFKKQRSATPRLMRVTVQRDEGYRGNVADAAKYVGMQLLSPDGLYYFHGYCDKDSELGKVMATLLSQAAPSLHLTLKVAYPGQSQPDDAVQVIALVADQWLVL